MPEEINTNAEQPVADATLNDIRDLLVKQNKSNKIRNIILIVIAAVFTATCIYVIVLMQQVVRDADQAMEAIDQVSETAESIQDSVDDINIDELNTTISNFASVTSNLKEDSDALHDAADNVKGLFSFNSSSK